MFNILSLLPQFRLPSEFPPQSVVDPGVADQGIPLRPAGVTEVGDLPDVEPRV